MRIMGIDPATRALGICILDGENGIVRSGCVRVRKASDPVVEEEEWLNRMDEIVDEVIGGWVNTPEGTGVDYVVIEQPEIRAGGVGEAANASGAVYKLAACVFTLRGLLRGAGYDVKLLRVSKWKGQLPKKVTMERMKRRWDWNGTDDNEGDAIALATWFYDRQCGK